MILQELLGILEAQALLEDLGNLRVIDKELVNVFFNFDWSKKRTGMPDKIGRNSKVEKKKINSMTELNDIIRGTQDPSDGTHSKIYNGYHMVGAVLIHDDKQIFSFCDTVFAGTPREPGQGHGTVFQVMATQEAVDLIPEDVRKKKYIAIEDSFKQHRVDHKDIHSLETICQELLKASGGSIDVLIVSFDADRTSKKVQRSNARYKQIRLPVAADASDEQKREYRKYLDSFKSDLEDRLAKYKQDKAPNAVDGPDLIKQVKDKGFPEFIKFMGFNYEKGRVNVSWADLEEVARGREKQMMHANNYISYRIMRNSPGFRELEHKMYELEKDLPEKDELSEKAYEAVWAAYKKKFHETVPPEQLEVVIGLKGGMAMPVDVRLKRREFR